MLLDVKGLRVSYRTVYGRLEAVRSLDFEVEKGESVAIVGESGCGKSSLGHAIVRLLPPNASYEGKLTVDGIDVFALKGRELRAYRGSEAFMIFQDPLNSLNPVKRVDRQMLEAIRTQKMMRGEPYDEDEATKVVTDGLRGVRMPDPEVILRRYPHELSGGQIQRVVIAMALVMKLIKELKAEYGMSVLFITHDMAVAYSVADRFLVMYAGELAELGPVDKVVTSPLHPYTEALVNSIPHKSKREGDLISIPGSPPNMLSPPGGCRFHPRCPKVMDICSTENPVIKPVEDRLLRCHLFD